MSNSFLDKFTTPSKPEGDPALFVVEILRLRKRVEELEQQIQAFKQNKPDKDKKSPYETAMV